jgi:chaperonin GroEL (HSP60 family)
MVQILVELAELQDQEVGDGTTSVVIVAAELLRRANDLVRNKIHPTSIISGYRLAMREVCFRMRDLYVCGMMFQDESPVCVRHDALMSEGAPCMCAA